RHLPGLLTRVLQPCRAITRSAAANSAGRSRWNARSLPKSAVRAKEPSTSEQGQKARPDSPVGLTECCGARLNALAFETDRDQSHCPGATNVLTKRSGSSQRRRDQLDIRT